MPDEIRVLAVRQPWASLIVEGLKTIEIRSRPTNIRERVAIYASKKINELDCINSRGYVWNDKIHPDILKTGVILGTVDIYSSTTHPVISSAVFNINHKYHMAQDSYFTKEGVHFWYLKDPIKFSIPIPYKPPKGAVVWSKTVLPEGY